MNPLTYKDTEYPTPAQYIEAKSEDSPERPRLHELQKAECDAIKDLTGTRAELDKAQDDAIRRAREKYTAAMEAYRQHERDAIEEFHRLLAKHEGISGHPKEKLLFEIAWGRGHSSGLYEVQSIYSELSDLLR